MKLNENFITTRGHNKYLLELRDLSRKLRNNPTEAEKKIWFQLLHKKYLEFKFLRQKPLDQFILDFYCPKLLLDIEIDGDSHVNKQNSDNYRDYRLGILGIKTIRYTNEEVINNFTTIITDIKLQIEIRCQEI